MEPVLVLQQWSVRHCLPSKLGSYAKFGQCEGRIISLVQAMPGRRAFWTPHARTSPHALEIEDADPTSARKPCVRITIIGRSRAKKSGGGRAAHPILGALPENQLRILRRPTMPSRPNRPPSRVKLHGESAGINAGGAASTTAASTAPMSTVPLTIRGNPVPR